MTKELAHLEMLGKSIFSFSSNREQILWCHDGLIGQGAALASWPWTHLERLRCVYADFPNQRVKESTPKDVWEISTGV